MLGLRIAWSGGRVNAISGTLLLKLYMIIGQSQGRDENIFGRGGQRGMIIAYLSTTGNFFPLSVSRQRPAANYLPWQFAVAYPVAMQANYIKLQVFFKYL
jgi:hypothetical protein